MGRNHRLEIKLTKEEKEKLKRKAKDFGVSLSSLARMVCLKGVISIKAKNSR